jgi:hypothetical protein
VSKWQITMWKLEHPLYGRFYIHAFHLDDKLHYSASRAWNAHPGAPVEHQDIHAERGGHAFASLEEAQAAVAVCIAELEALGTPKPSTCGQASRTASCVEGKS